MRILHVSPHLGGGCGNVLGSLTRGGATRGESHEFLLLEEPGEESRRYIETHDLEATIFSGPTDTAAQERLMSSDVVQIEYWNHPLLYRFLSSVPLPDKPVVAHCHVQGSTPPQLIAPAALRLFDYFVATTASTLSNARLGALAEDRVVAIPSGLAKPSEPVRTESDKFGEPIIIGYIGTLDFIKLHPKTVAFCEEICRTHPQIRFEFHGPSPGPELLDQIAASAFSERIRYVGYSTDVSATFSGFDIFFYPLRPGHYGTGEQVLLEAMAAALPVVAMAGAAESAIIEHGRSGYLARQEKDVSVHLSSLIGSAGLRRQIGAAARERVHRDFSADRARERFSGLYRRAVEGRHGGSARQLMHVTKDARFSIGARLFLAGMAEMAPLFVATLSRQESEKQRAVAEILAHSEAFKSRTRGTPGHYLGYFPDDRHLRYWSALFDS